MSNCKGVFLMSKISLNKLSELIIQRRKELGMTQEDIQAATGINRQQIGRIERGVFVPSLPQLESITTLLKFSIADILEDEKKDSVFVALRGQAKTQEEAEGMDKLFTMILCLNQQKNLRSKLSNEQSK